MGVTLIPNSDITIYNKYTDASTRAEKYQRTVINDVVWQATKARSGAGSGVLASNVATIFIDFAHGTQYALPKAWSLSKTGKWTLQEGDVIVRGAVTDEISDSFTMTALRAKYDYVVTVSSVDAMDQGSPNVQHWQVGCK